MNDQIKLLSIKNKKESDKVDLPLENTLKMRQENVVQHNHIWKYHKNLHDCQLHAWLTLM